MKRLACILLGSSAGIAFTYLPLGWVLNVYGALFWLGFIVMVNSEKS